MQLCPVKKLAEVAAIVIVDSSKVFLLLWMLSVVKLNKWGCRLGSLFSFNWPCDLLIDMS